MFIAGNSNVYHVSKLFYGTLSRSLQDNVKICVDDVTVLLSFSGPKVIVNLT